MRLARLLAIASLALAGAAGAQGLRIGTTTHFGQGWPADYWRLVTGSSIGTVREAVAWRQIEARPGRYDFTPANAGRVARACDAGRKVLLVLVPRHPAYDGGGTVVSAAGQAAFARFAGALDQRYGACLAGLEIGNEINARGAFTGAAAGNPVGAYISNLRALRDARLAVPILGGSTNAIATGFLERLFAAGMLPLVDGVVVHPYRRDPANVDWELSRVRAAMRRAGRVVPIWATEFGLPTTDEAAAAAHLIQMTTLLSAAGVAHADWYALVDHPPFPTLGLYAADGRAKQAARALDYLNRVVLPRGEARREGTDPTLSHYRFGADRQVVWGTPRAFSVSGPAEFRDMAGQQIGKPAAIGEIPFFVEGTATIVPAPVADVIADSRLGFARTPWRYTARAANGRTVALDVIDGNWTSYIGNRAMPGLAINQYDLIVPPRATAVVSYAVPAGGPVTAAACLAPATPASVGAGFELRRNGVAIGERIAVDRRRVLSARIVAKAGDVIEFAAPGGMRATVLHYRFRLQRSAADAPPC